MKTLRTIILLLIVIAYKPSLCQTVEVQASNELKTPKYVIYGGFIGSIDNLTYYVRQDIYATPAKPEGGKSIEAYNENLDLKETSNLPIRVDGKLLEPDFPFIWNDHLYVTGFLYNSKGNIKTLYIAELNPESLDPVGDPIELLSFEGYALKQYGSFYVSITNDIMSVVGVPNTGSPIGPAYAKKNSEPAEISFAVYDKEFNLMWKNKLVMNTSFKDFRYRSHILDEDGNIYYMGNRENSKKQYVVTSLTNNGKTVKEYDLGLNGGTIGSMTRTEDNGITTYTGFCYVNGSSYDGVYQLRVDMKTGEVIHETISPLELPWLDEISKGISIKELATYNLIYQGSAKLSDGSQVLFAELYDDKTEANSYEYTYMYKDIAIVHVSENGEILGTLTIPKDQVFRSTGMGSFSYIVTDYYHIRFFYNDHPYNLSSGSKPNTATRGDCVLVKADIYGSNIEDIEMVYNPESEDAVVEASRAFSMDTETLLFYGVVNDKFYKMIKLIFD